MADLLMMLQSKSEQLDEEAEKKAAEQERLAQKKQEDEERLLKEKREKKKKKKAEELKKTLENDKKLERAGMKKVEAAKELYETEVTYVRSMMILINGFKKPLEAEKIVSEQEVTSLFSNVETLLGFHKEFLKKIKERVAEFTVETSLGDLILELIPYLKTYTQYTSNYDNCIQTLQNLTDKNAKFSAYLDRCMKAPTFGGLTIAGYLIMPIQRIPRYKMLLEVMVQNTPESHADYADLTAGLEQVMGVAEYINGSMAQEANMKQLLNIQSQVNVQIVKPSRQFIMEGTMHTTCFKKKKDKKSRRKGGEVVVLPGMEGNLGGSAATTPSSPLATSSTNASGVTITTTNCSSTPPPLTRSVSTKITPPTQHQIPSLDRVSGGAVAGNRKRTGSGSVIIPSTVGAPARSSSVSDLNTLRYSKKMPNPNSLPSCKVYLFDDMLVIAHPKDKSKTASPSLITSWVKTDELYPRTFEIVTLGTSFIMFAATEQEKTKWVEAIEAAIEKLLEKEHLRNKRSQYALRQRNDSWSVISLSSPDSPVLDSEPNPLWAGSGSLLMSPRAARIREED
ncbi:RhoGEF domain containing protein [Balamuthia mandrillaris]